MDCQTCQDKSCKKCKDKARSAKYRLAHPERRKASNAKWYRENTSKATAIAKKWITEHPEEVRIRRQKWNVDNPAKAKEPSTKARNKFRSTIKGKIAHRIGNGVRVALKMSKRGRAWESVVGYTCDELQTHIESLFVGEMNWDEFMKGNIHIDHVVPQNQFHYQSHNDSAFKQCWALTNLQPLWAVDNLRKKKK